MSPSSSVDQRALADEMASGWLPGVSGEPRQRSLLTIRDLVADWAVEADPMPDPDAVVRFQRESLDEMLALTGGDRVVALDAELLRRNANHLNAAAYRLATRTIDGEIRAEDSAREGRALLEQCEQITASADRLGSPRAAEAVRQALGETMMDALYAVERKATSHRLAHARPAATTPAEQGGGYPSQPPDIRP
jgi:hypothetical protein